MTPVSKSATTHSCHIPFAHAVGDGMHFPFRALITCGRDRRKAMWGRKFRSPRPSRLYHVTDRGVGNFSPYRQSGASIQSSSTLYVRQTTAWQRAGISRTRTNSFSVPIASQASFRASHTTNDSVSRNQANTAYRPGVIVAHTSDGYLRDAYR
jgi:hypothetical protein